MGLKMKELLLSHNLILKSGAISTAHPKILTNLPALKHQILNYTAFLIPLDNPNWDMYQRLICIRDGIEVSPTCKTCQIPIKYNFRKKYFARFCSISCASSQALTSRTNTMMNRYGYKSAIQNPTFKNKMADTMMDRYGHVHYVTSPDFKLKSKHTLMNNHGVHHASHIGISSDVLDQTYDKTTLEQLNQTSSLVEIAHSLGVSPSLMSKRFREFGINPIIHPMSFPHKQIVSYLQDELGLAVQTNITGLFSDRRQVDIYLPDLSVAIELDGVFWHSEKNGNRSKTYHSDKTTELLAAGVRLVHVYDTEWIAQQDIVRSRLAVILKQCSNIIMARKCTIRIVPNDVKRDFLITNHIQGDAPSSINLGLYVDNMLVAIMTFSAGRYGSQQYELIRYASMLNTVVSGGGSKLFSFFLTKYTPTSVVSYSDKRWNTGKFYSSIGFAFSHSSSPNYKYFYKSDIYQLYSRIAFQKHKLAAKLDIFDPNLTEWQNMQNNGYDRIWDCGNDVWIWNAG